MLILATERLDVFAKKLLLLCCMSYYAPFSMGRYVGVVHLTTCVELLT